MWITSGTSPLPGDVKIVLATVGKVLHHEGISGGSSATMEEFRGTPEEVGK